MPASMIRPVTGSSESVSGRSTATPVVEPRPGSTPTTVPMSTPTKHHSRFSVDSAVEKPRTRLSSTSASDSDEARGQRHVEEEHEDHVDGGDYREGHDRRGDPRAPLHHRGDEEGQEEEADEETDEWDEHDGEGERDEHDHELAAAHRRRPAEDVEPVVVRPGPGLLAGGEGAPREVVLRGGASRGSVRGCGDDLRQPLVVRCPLSAQGRDQFPAGDQRRETADDRGHQPGADPEILQEEAVPEGDDEGDQAEGGEQAVDHGLLDRDALLGRGRGHPLSTLVSSSLLPLRYSVKSSPLAVLACR